MEQGKNLSISIYSLHMRVVVNCLIELNLMLACHNTKPKISFSNLLLVNVFNCNCAYLYCSRWISLDLSYSPYQIFCLYLFMFAF